MPAPRADEDSQQQHAHSHDGSAGHECDEEHDSRAAEERPASEEVAEMRQRLTEQLFIYLDQEGLDADAEAVSGLAGLVAGILENGKLLAHTWLIHVC
jgi:hypothetical protein